MSKNDMNINISVKEESDNAKKSFAGLYGTSNQFAQKLSKQPGYDKVSKEYKDILRSTSKKIEQMLNSTSLSISDFKKLHNLLDKFNNTLVDAAQSMTKMPHELKTLYEKVKLLNDDRNTLNTKKTDLLKQFTTDKSHNTITGVRDSNLSDYVYKTNRGNWSKNTIGANISSATKALDKNLTIGKRDSMGNVIEISREQYQAEIEKEAVQVAQAQSELNKLNQKLSDTKVLLETVNTAIDKITATMPQDVTVANAEFVKTLSKHAQESSAIISNAIVSMQGDNTNKEVVNNTVKLTEGIQKQQTTLGKAFKQVSIYAIALRTLKSAAREASATITELDKSLTNQSMVTGRSRTEVYKLLKQYQQMATKLGTTSKEVAEVATEYLRQGKTTQEALTLTNAAVSAARVASISATESVNYLTTALNGFQLSADMAMKVSDKFAAIAATSATDYEELAVALSKVASQANLAGMSIDYTTALLAKGIETTREAPETIGTALKTVIARMREMTDYGATLEGDTDVNNVETQLAYVGIALKNANGELRSTQDVLDDLGKKWDTLNKNQQAAIAKALAGTRQQSRLISMMSDYERVTQLQQVSERSAGATMAQMEKYSNSLEAATNRVTSAWEKLVNAITNSDAIITIVNTLSKAIDTLGKTVLFQGNGAEKFVGAVTLGVGAYAGARKALGAVNERVMLKREKKEQDVQQIEDARENIKTTHDEFVRQDFKDWEKDPKNVEANKEVVAARLENEKAITAQKNIQDELDKAQEVLSTKRLAAEIRANNVLTEQKKQQLELSNQERINAEYISLMAERDKAIESGDFAKQDELATKLVLNNEAKNESQLAYAKSTEKLIGLNTEYKKSLTAVKTAKTKVTKIENKLSKAQEQTAQAQEKLDTATQKRNEQIWLNSKEYEKVQEKLVFLQSQQNKLGLINNAVMLARNVILDIANTLNFVAALSSKKMTVAKIAETKALIANKFGVDQLNAAWKALMASNPIGRVLLAVAALVTLVTIILSICSVLGVFESKASKAADSVNTLSAEIYDLNKKATDLDTAIDKFDALDQKIIKTKADTEEMKKALEEAGNALDTEVPDKKKNSKLYNEYGGKSEQEVYNSLTTDRAKREFLANTEKRTRDLANAKRQEQLNTINSLKGDDFKAFMTDSGAKYVQARDAIYAINNNNIYESIDALKELGKYTDEQISSAEDVTEAILGEVDAYTALDYANNPGKIKKLTKAITELTTTINGQTVAYAEMLNSADYSLKQQVKAYEAIKKSLDGDTKALDAFNSVYSQYQVFSDINDDVLDFIENANISIDALNTMYTGYKQLQKAGVNITKEDYQSRFNIYLETLAEFDGDAVAATEQVFGDILSQFDKGSDEYIKAWNSFINIFGNAVTVGALNMGQNMDKFNNQVDNFYKKASEWNTMSDSDKASFLQDNADLFAGPDGDKLLAAFESGNYNLIQSALETNKTLLDNRKELLRQVEQELKVELAREGDDYNAAYVKQLEGYKKHLENQDTLFRASLETRLTQQNNAIEQYKSMLEKEQNALTDSLDKRKDAYSKYFDSINNESEDQDYEEQAAKLQANLGKLASSTNASSISQMESLQQSLEDLEKERLKTLRERAQEALTQSIEDQVTSINNKFDTLLNDQQALLTALTSDSESNQAAMLAKLISTQVSSEGLTAVGLEDYLSTLQSTLGNYLTGINWDSLSTSTNENNNLVLNIAGKEVELSSSDQQNMYQIIMQALQQLGLK